MADLKHAKYTTPTEGTYKSQFLEIDHPFLLMNEQCYNLERQLNREQQSILKDMLMKKLLVPDKPLHLFLMGEASTRKTIIAKVIFEALV